VYGPFFHGGNTGSNPVGKIRGFISWQVTGIYSRMIPAMFEHKQLGYLDETIEQQCLFAFWSTGVGMTNVATDTCERIFKACTRLREEHTVTDPYRAARPSIHGAHIGLYALVREANDVLATAVERYRQLRAEFNVSYPELRFVGDWCIDCFGDFRVPRNKNSGTFVAFPRRLFRR
jgi:hypothetical protein